MTEKREACNASPCQVPSFTLAAAGVSLSSGARSVLAINPESAQAEALRSWWDTEGRGAALTPLTNEQRCALRHLNLFSLQSCSGGSFLRRLP